MHIGVTWIEEVDSTNEEMKRRLKSGSSLNNYDIIAARFQTAGKGQRQNVWESAYGMNLTFSMYFQPNSLLISDAFLLNQVIAVLIVDFLESQGLKQVQIKWPNDILIGDKKICGVLIENTLVGKEIVETVIGIGLNVNQQVFHLNDRSTSLIKETNEQRVLELLVEDFQDYLRKTQYFLGRKNLVEDKYNNAFFGLFTKRRFRTENEQFEGVIKGIDAQGRLKLLVQDVHRYFNQNELRFVFD